MLGITDCWVVGSAVKKLSNVPPGKALPVVFSRLARSEDPSVLSEDPDPPPPPQEARSAAAAAPPAVPRNALLFLLPASKVRQYENSAATVWSLPTVDLEPYMGCARQLQLERFDLARQ